MNLFINLYKDKNKERQAELDRCLSLNMANILIERIYCVVDDEYEKPISIPEKMIFINHRRRPSYMNYFAFIDIYGQNDAVNCIANSDIYFDEDSVRLIEENIQPYECYALSRWDVKEGGIVKLFNRADSQDVWVFRGKVKQVNSCRIYLGVPGCLSGETIIKYKRGKRTAGRDIKLEQLYYKFNNIKCSNTRWKIKHIPAFVQSLNIETGKIFFNRIISVIQSGVKDTIKIILEDNSSIILTEDHPVANENKEFNPAGNLKIGDLVLCRDMTLLKKNIKKKYSPRAVVYIKYHPYAENKKVNGHHYKRVRKYRLVYEAKLNNMSYEDYVNCLKNDLERSSTLKFLDPKLEVHHKDENSLNDIYDNLDVLTKKEHAKIHNITERLDLSYTKTKKIIKIEKYKSIMTYDIQMEGPSHNFCANDIIVHNCDNAIAHRLDLAGYTVTNPSKDIRTYHLHNSGVRNYTPKDRVPPPYKLIHPHNLPKMNWIREIALLKDSSLNSQYSEDTIISHVFKNIGVTNKFFVDLGAGAYDGKMSNTRTLKSNGWDGFGVDCANITDEWIIKEFVKPDNVCQILASQNTPTEFDFLNLDLDSSDYWVLQNVLKQYSPRLICTEFNATLIPDIPVALEYEDGYTWDNTNKYGYSYAAGKKLLEQHGYVIIFNLHDTNIFAVKSELIKELQFPTVGARRNIYHPINNDAKWIAV